MPEGEDEVVMVFEGVYLADPRTARVGVRRNHVALLYTDCRNFEEVSYETCVNHDLDHATTKVTFRPSMAEVEVRTRLSSAPPCDLCY